MPDPTTGDVLEKWHGAGNDFLVALRPGGPARLDGDDARRWCDRHTGIGADGLIEGTMDGRGLVMSLHNADGSRAEVSGNGLRCLAAAAVAHGLVAEGTLDVATGAGARRVTIALDPSSGRAWGSVGMGEVALADGGSLATGVVAQLGNPHVVIEDPGGPDADLIARAVALADGLDAGANVEFVTVLTPDHLSIRVVERGVGLDVVVRHRVLRHGRRRPSPGARRGPRDGHEPRRGPRRHPRRPHRHARRPGGPDRHDRPRGALVTVYPSSLIERAVRERIVLVGVVLSGHDPDDVEAGLDELALLVDTAGADVLARMVQRRDAPDPATYLGKGKVAELHELCLAVDADTVVFDQPLTPAQQRNLERLLGRTAIDRTAVILDIFAQNARSPEGKAQVELALLRYRLPRLRGRGVELSQQAGRIGTRGPGETQLEVDRRRLVRRMHKLETELKDVDRTRSTQRSPAGPRTAPRGRPRRLHQRRQVVAAERPHRPRAPWSRTASS